MFNLKTCFTITFKSMHPYTNNPNEMYDIQQDLLPQSSLHIILRGTFTEWRSPLILCSATFIQLNVSPQDSTLQPLLTPSTQHSCHISHISLFFDFERRSGTHIHFAYVRPTSPHPNPKHAQILASPKFMPARCI